MKKQIPCTLLMLTFITSNSLKIPNSLKNQVIEWRHQLHQNPELSNGEYKTATFIEKDLKSPVITFQKGVVKIGFIALLRVKKL